MRVLVTGAEGFIGSHVVEALLANGLEVNAFVLYNFNSDTGWLREIRSTAGDKKTVYFGDVRDPQTLEAAMKGCDAVIHLAALIGIPYSYEAVRSYIDVNVTGTLNVLQTALRLESPQVVVASTSEVYGSAQTVPIREDHPLNPQSPYAASKVAADSLALSFWRSFGLRVKVLRPFNTFGPRQSPRAVIPTIIHQIQSGSATVHLGRTDTTRDFTFVKDTARAFCDSLMSDECVGSVTNIGSSFEISIGDLALTIGQLMHADVTIISEETRLRPASSEVVRLFASNELARERIGWVPQFAGEEGFRRGLLATIEWIQGQGRLELEYKK